MKISARLEAHPALGWFGSLFSLLCSWLSWLVENAGTIAQIFGVGAAVFGFIAGYYTMRIQRRTWRENAPRWRRLRGR